MPIRGLVVDDHPIIRDALVSSLLSLQVFDELETVNSFQALIDKLEQDTAFQLLILDLSLTDISGADGIVHIREHYPQIPIMVFSASDSPDVIAQCFEHGVHGFVSKNSSMKVFVNAIQVVLAGSMYIPPSAASLMGFEPISSNDDDLMLTDEPVHFTPKQHEVFEQLKLGVPNKTIGKRLNLAEGTVKAHLHSIYQILGVHSRAQAILKAQQLRIMS